MILAVPICAFAWSYAGAANTDKNWRRLGIGCTIAGLSFIISINIYTFLIILLMWGATSIGYGIPDSTDSGSDLGRFWFSIVKSPNETRFNMSEMTHFLTNFLTRATVGVLYGVSLIPAIRNPAGIISISFVAVWTLLVNVYIPPKEFKIKPFKTIFNSAEALTGAGIGIGACIAII